MAWWNPQDWFAAKELDSAQITQRGCDLVAAAAGDQALAEDKYRFKVQIRQNTGEVVHVTPLDDKDAPRDGVEALLTPALAARLRLLSLAAGGDGLTKTAADISGQPMSDGVTADQLFGAEAFRGVKMEVGK